MFYVFMSMYKWSGQTKYQNINGPPDHLCCHKWSLWTIYARTTYVVIVHFLENKMSTVLTRDIEIGPIDLAATRLKFHP